MPETGGYPDYQRVVNWDGELLVANTERVLKEKLTLGPFNVARFGWLAGALGGRFAKGVAAIEWKFTWYNNETGSVEVGHRTFMTNPEITSHAQIHLPNLGPWLNIVANFAAVEVRTKLILQPTNRPYPTELIPQVATILPYTVKKIAKGGGAIYVPGSYYSGPAHMFVGSVGQEMAPALEVYNPEEAWEVAEQYTQTATNTRAVYTIVIPTAPWRISVTNLGAAETEVGVSVTPSMTGSI
jgi:hypothetical protein